MCGIVGLQLRGERHVDQLGFLLADMLGQVGERGPDSAGVGIYGDDTGLPAGRARVSTLCPLDPDTLRSILDLPELAIEAIGELKTISAAVGVAELAEAAGAVPDCLIIGSGQQLTVLKGVGAPVDVARRFGLARRRGYQAVGHTRMATESAVTLAHGHPFSVRPELCLVHNGSFANHDTVRRELAAEGRTCDTDNDSEVAARFLGRSLDRGNDLDKSLRLLGERFEGFFTLLVTTDTEFAVVRDRIAGKPAVVAETADWVAMASEYRALTGLPGIGDAHVFEPEPEEVYRWKRV